mmetsp:Transcript_8266/g.14154  ORF Transcript_8266/g.14154 Transcript_8266/m.14154 type:complete len:91 (+) Transcript_8266:965-1237(+)
MDAGFGFCHPSSHMMFCRFKFNASMRRKESPPNLLVRVAGSTSLGHHSAMEKQRPKRKIVRFSHQLVEICKTISILGCAGHGGLDAKMEQ